MLIDVQPGSYEMDYEAVKKAVGPHTKAIVPVDIAGVPCDYDKILKIAEETRECFQPSENKYQKAMGRIMISWQNIRFMPPCR